jgi:hypothetical protein
MPAAPRSAPTSAPLAGDPEEEELRVREPTLFRVLCKRMRFLSRFFIGDFGCPPWECHRFRCGNCRERVSLYLSRVLVSRAWELSSILLRPLPALFHARVSPRLVSVSRGNVIDFVAAVAGLFSRASEPPGLVSVSRGNVIVIDFVAAVAGLVSRA